MIKTDKTILGSWVNSASPIVAELMATTGFDFLTVDAEHSAIDLPQTQILFQAIKSGNQECAPLVRLPNNDYYETKRYMDAGAAGVIAPLINTAAQACEVVEAVKFPPHGARGVGFCRANRYGMRLNELVADDYLESFVCVQIEHIDAINNLEEILSVEGIDVAMIGPYDLSASMGITGEFEHQDMLAAKDRILRICREKSIAPGIHVVQPDPQEAARRALEGYRFIAYSLDITMLMQSCLTGLEAVKKLIME